MANRDITESGVQEVLRTMGIPTSFQGLKEDVAGRAELLATLGSGMAGAYAGMGGGLLEMMRSGRPDLAIDEYQRIQEAMTYMPRTQGGIERVQAIGEFLEPVANVYEQYGQAVGEESGYPIIGEYVKEFAGPEFLLGGLGALPRSARKSSRFAENVASQTTQRANTVGTAVKASNYLDEIGATGKTLDYGAGLGENAKAIKADETFEPFPQGEFSPTYTNPADVPANSYGRIISTNVLNVLPPDIRLEAVQTIGKALEPGGTALIQTWDVGAAKAGMKSKKATPVPDEANAYTTSTGSYQKGFSKQELQEYIANTLGPGYLVEPVPNKAGISGTAVTIKKLADLEGSPVVTPSVTNDAEVLLRQFKQEQPVQTIDDIYTLAPQAQNQLVGALGNLKQKYDIDVVNPGLKAKSTTQEKISRKGYDQVSELTDIVRSGIVAKNFNDVESIIEDLGQTYRVIDEGWHQTPTGFVDRKVMIQTPSGLVAEVQIWTPAMYEAKFTKGGQELYAEFRSATDPKIRADLEAQMRQVYGDALKADQDLSKLFGTEN